MTPHSHTHSVWFRGSYAFHQLHDNIRKPDKNEIKSLFSFWFIWLCTCVQACANVCVCVCVCVCECVDVLFMRTHTGRDNGTESIPRLTTIAVVRLLIYLPLK